MNCENIKIDGYTVTIAQDEHASNPFTEFDCEPPLLVYSYDRSPSLDVYNDAPATIGDFVRLLPDSFFVRGKRMALIKELNCSVREFAQAKREWGYNVRDAFIEVLTEEIGATPVGWRSAGEWFEMAEHLLDLAGVPCHYMESHGYCQGDTVKLLAIATPEWVTKVGAGGSLEKQCEGACELYGAWAWGDVYGIYEIHAPGTVDEDGDEIEGEELWDAPVWGFYGRDHEKSGLLESARDSIAYHKKESERKKVEQAEAERREKEEAFNAACRDLMTV